MKYKSTRGGERGLSFSEAVVKGLAKDGGLFVPESHISIDEHELLEMSTLNYEQLAIKIISKFASDFTTDEVSDCVKKAYSYGSFPEAVAPVTKLNDTLSVLELWHGPTCAFKDMALQILPNFMTHAIKKTGEEKEIIILTATSGDTGKAALEGFKDIPGIKVLVFYPQEGVSEMQKYQMITQQGSNVSVVAVKGNFDDAQSGVKKIFSDTEYEAELADVNKELSSANSINWGRLLPQIIYYFHAYLTMVKNGEIILGNKVNFVVPTGNFGNILASYYAKKAGLPINRIICASNDNNVLSDFMSTGTYNKNRKFVTTISPAMDILISSNLERLLYDMTEENDVAISTLMNELKNDGVYTVDKKTMNNINNCFWASFATEKETMDAISAVYGKYNYLIDPHTAVGINVYEKYVLATGDTTKTVAVSTASPFKFNASVAEAILGKEDISKLDEFEILEFLSEKTGLEIPMPLRNLNKKEILHKTICEVSDMKKEVQNFICSK